MEQKDILMNLRRLLAQEGLSGILIPRQDCFSGTNYPPDKDRLKTLSGFSGSAGMAFVSAADAVLFVDARYTAQARRQSFFTVVEVTGLTQIITYLKDKIGPVLGYDARRTSRAQYEALKEALGSEVTLNAAPQKKIDVLLSKSMRHAPIRIFDYPDSLDGLTKEAKTASVVAFLKENKLGAFYLTDPEDVSWLTNRRSDENRSFPVVFETMFVDSAGIFHAADSADWFKGQSVGYDPHTLSMAEWIRLNRLGVTLKPMPAPLISYRAIKTPAALAGMRQAAWQDSVVFCRFLAFAQKQRPFLTESRCVSALKRFRRQVPLYFDDSFDTIAAAGANAALAHYKPKSGTPRITAADQVLLIDMGAHYLSGTTDMTRTIAVGPVSDLVRRRYTQVLQGHIDLACMTLKKDTPASALDAAARAPLAQDKVSYGHATGHGIGQFLGVHEAMPVIAPHVTDPIRPGMVFSNEPGFYDEAAGFGIRLENMVEAVATESGEIVLKTITLVPFDPELIDVSLLNAAQKAWLKAYHQEIQNRIFPLLKPYEKQVLKPMVDFFVKNG